MNPPLVSVIIPTRDRAELLVDTLSALRSQTYPHLEVIVVDDGSTDATPEVVEEARAKDTRVRGLRHAQSRGAATARNTGAAVAGGEYFLFEDDDCRGDPDRIAVLVEAIEAAPDAAYAYCWMASRNTDGSLTIHGAHGPSSVGTPFALIRADAFRAAGGFDGLMPRLQDFDLWIRLLAYAPAVAVPRVLFETVRDNAGISASPARLLAASERILDKYRDSDFPSRHLAAMHRRLAGSLIVNGFRAAGLSHLLRAVRLRKRSPQSWMALGAGVAGVRAYRIFIGAHDKIVRAVAARRGSG